MPARTRFWYDAFAGAESLLYDASAIAPQPTLPVLKRATRRPPPAVYPTIGDETPAALSDASATGYSKRASSVTGPMSARPRAASINPWRVIVAKVGAAVVLPKSGNW